MTFHQRYQSLNPAQQQAVDTIEGPVLVVAGPGSGKTELLALRIANILQKTDALPSSILCLTFTNAAAENMRQRLIGLIGREAYKVAIHTFHSFGTEIIAQNPEYFFDSASFTAADELTQTQLLAEIFKALPLDDPLSTKHPTEGFIFLKDTKTRLQDLKQAAITPEQFAKNLENSAQFLEQATPFLAAACSERISAKTLHHFDQLLLDLQNLPPADLKNQVTQSLQLAIQEAHAGSKPNTKPLTAWKNDYTKKDDQGRPIFADQKRIPKLLSLQKIYTKYQEQLQKRGLFDYADMLLQTLQTLQKNPALRFDLQEKYQYLLVDEFQDTSAVQLRLLDQILDSSVNEGRPNVLAVGDDDQSIYKFQGANLDNILTFHEKYREPVIIVLDQNYRSTQPILDYSREIILQASDRLETRLENITKNLRAAKPHSGQIHEMLFQTELEELTWIVDQIRQNKTPLNEIALIARKHSHLELAAKVLRHFQIPVNYERQENLLEKPLVREIITILRFISDTDDQSPLPEILSFHFWQIDRLKIWQLSTQAYRQRRLWLELLIEDPSTTPIAQFLIELSQKALTHTAEEIIDLITHGQFRQYYFQDINSEYLENLKILDSFLKAIRQHQKNFTVSELLHDFIEPHQEYKIPLNYTLNLRSSEESVNLLTAHGAKGLEFQQVFIINASDKAWCTRGQTNKISFTKNLKISADQDKEDDFIRLFYVALTRAKNDLFITSHQQNDYTSGLTRLRFLPETEPEITPVLSAEKSILLNSELRTDQPLQIEETTLLQSLVQNYQLSPTHLNHFLDLTYHGPQNFLQEHILRFPQKMGPAAAYGSAVHDALDKLQSQYRLDKTLPAATQLLANFERSLKKQHLNAQDFSNYLEKGQRELSAFYEHNAPNLSPQDLPEFSFHPEAVKIGQASVTGKIDRISLDPQTQTALVIDYKTGKPFNDWNASDERSQRKAWEYKNQLIFYKLLLENSRTFGGKYQVHHGRLEFLESPKSLNLQINDHDLDQTKKLIQIVHQKITSLDFPDTSRYSPDFAGTNHFINDLLDGHI